MEASREAFARHAWHEAADGLRAFDLERPLAADDLEQLAEAEWWLGNLDACIDARERAYQQRIAADERHRAAKLALDLAGNYTSKLASSRAQGWHRRALRLLQEEPECVEQGYLALEQVWTRFRREAPEEARHLAQRAVDLGARFGDSDLEMMAQADLGRVLVNTGAVEEGMALQEEAGAAALGGELGPYATGVIFCSTIGTSQELTDLGRAGEWSEAAERWCERQVISGFPGVCRVYRAEAMRLRGAWADAELEVRRACGELRLFAPKVAGSAFRELGQIRLRIGDLDGAEDAFLQALELGSNGQPGLAQLHLARGRSHQALVGLLELLERDNWSDLDRAPLLPTLAEVAIDAGELDHARAASEELERTAGIYATPMLNAAAAVTRGRIELASEQGAAAAKSFRRALQLYQDVEVPYEAAAARFLLARAYRSGGETELAAPELAAARDAFDRLGAVRDARLVLDEIESQPSGSPVRAPTTTAVAPSSPERTFMFTDIVGSTALVAAIGDAAWSDLVHWHDDTLRALFAKHGGQEVDHAGDGFFVAFAQPAAATACAVAIQRTLARHRREHGFAPEVRIGIHAAAAQHGRGGYRGKGVHEAARVAALADGGEILVSRLTLGDDRVAFGVSEPRSVQLKGLAEPLSVVTLDWH